MGQAADGAKHVLHRRCLAEHFRCIGDTVVPCLFAAHAFVDGASDQLDSLVDIERLRKIFECPALKRGDRAVEIRERRHDDDGQARHPFAHGLQQLEAGAARHPDVGDQHLWAVVIQRACRLAHIREAAGREVLACKGFLEHPADRLIVVYYPDRLHMVGQRS